MDIEQIATSTLALSISQTDFLSSNINERDKEPSWDGAIYIYTDKSKRKSFLKGRVPVQVKGKLSENLNKKTITFPIDVIDLKNYLYNGGVIYFVVFISKDSSITKIYYTSLLPIKIRILLNDAGNQKTINTELNEFPAGNDEKVEIFLNFHIDQSKQYSFVNAKLLSLEELEKKGALESISVRYTGYGLNREKFHRALLTKEIYIYASIKGSIIEQPLDFIPKNVATKEEINGKILVDEKLFYEGYDIIRSRDKYSIKIGQSFTIDLNYDMSNSFRINFNLAGSLKNRIKDLEFLLEILNTRAFKINTVIIPISPTEKELRKLNFKKLSNILTFYQKAQDALDQLNIKDELNLDDISYEEERNLSILITAFIDKKPVNGLKDNLNCASKIKVSNLTFLLAFIKCGNDRGTYNIYDFFKTKFEVYFEDSDGKKCYTSQYTILRKNDYLEVSNIDYNAICSTFFSIDGGEEYYAQVNGCLLEMIAAYDEGGQKDKVLLRTAKELALWLLNNENELNYEIKILNYLQIIRRERDFNNDEIMQLCEITENGNMKEDILVGAYLLLGNQICVEMHFQNLDSTVKEAFKQYPIYKFWQQNNPRKIQPPSPL